MHDSLDALRATLARMSDVELTALMSTADGSRHLAAGLLAFVALACEWEHARRGDTELHFVPPKVTTRMDEVRATRAAFAMMLDRFEGHPRAREGLVAAGEVLGTPADAGAGPPPRAGRRAH